MSAATSSTWCSRTRTWGSEMADDGGLSVDGVTRRIRTILACRNGGITGLNGMPFHAMGVTASAHPGSGCGCAAPIWFASALISGRKFSFHDTLPVGMWGLRLLDCDGKGRRALVLTRLGVSITFLMYLLPERAAPVPVKCTGAARVPSALLGLGCHSARQGRAISIVAPARIGTQRGRSVANLIWSSMG
jgi:hypothetical protein